ncbi:hypothetical protein [Sphingobium xenophagum]|uniref:hypothetical protein n=1 Tax=Sphingobium xenophagum TaxID=121428 RepID=UPI000474AA29|nr:hypothetical protein [Sphingobium xenophagum]
MSTTDNPETSSGNSWEGLREIDQAIAENRLMEYRVKKAWADPWERRGLLVFAGLISAFAIYAFICDVIF